MSHLPTMVAVFATWHVGSRIGLPVSHPSSVAPIGRTCHAARSIMNDPALGGFMFAAFCGASEHSDEIEYDVAEVVGCAACRHALKMREREVGSSDTDAGAPA